MIYYIYKENRLFFYLIIKQGYAFRISVSLRDYTCEFYKNGGGRHKAGQKKWKYAYSRYSNGQISEHEIVADSLLEAKQICEKTLSWSIKAEYDQILKKAKFLEQCINLIGEKDITEDTIPTEA